MLSRSGDRERYETEDPCFSDVIFLVLRNPRLGEEYDEETECIRLPSDMSSEPVLRGVPDVSISTEGAESMAWVAMALSGSAEIEQRDERKKRLVEG